MGRIASAAFLDSIRGWVVTYKNEVWRTSDSGATWLMIGSLPDDITPPVLNITFVDEQLGWLTTPFAVLRTDNSGAKWQRAESLMQLKSNKELFGRCAFIDPLVGWVLGSKGEVYRTVNGGVNWQRHSISSTMNDLQAFFFIDRESGWLSETPRGRIYETEDGGQKWHPQRMPIPELTIRSLHFISKQEGWAAGLWENAKDEQYSSGSVVIHTVDGGQTWERLFSCKAESRFDVINFADRSHGWLVSPTGAYRSDDGGRSWKLVLRSQEGLLSENSRNCE